MSHVVEVNHLTKAYGSFKTLDDVSIKIEADKIYDEVSQLLEHVMVIDKGQILLDEDADDLRGKAYTVVGPASKVEAFTQGQNVIHRSSYGALMTATIYGSFQGNVKREALELGLETAPVSLQQLIVHLTGNDMKHKKANRT